ncbi:hypothetical protein DIU31_000755 [Mucilaginibacter rubeus]|uniref:Uncharacterized protein n=2 Tax=Mucilaginibacter TaxID=423349 RepID=A0AAE6MG46_9SPHI|nr:MULTISPECIES: DUF6624 domain-containing protein [Mucilaginibacter]QEM02118.1 hypothetical protein DIU31_000755 [Mucilaginibacter rubeus]QEM14746.1 hypothetical protein DIU38_000780 [Mucilaginibacter gossypii]QTE42547.1 hypothetical protein J3L19_27040 [Mucilaginibacter rubeus]QTE49148.1 hypothetical protein J3L21_27005 [Mucilaginibacter rubeus]QTE54246.1 hypothetical protein J3L23_18630 [Mucilaginibacter rubeus]
MKYLICISFFLFVRAVSAAQVTSFTIDSSKLNKPLMAVLDTIFQLDQSVRIKYLQAKRDNVQINVADSLQEVMHKTDSQNLIRVNAILTKYGWLGPQKVGITGSQALFLVIQHADLQTQQNYLQMIGAAEKNGEILSSNLAILEDRINMRTGKKQVYGSQGFTDKQTGKIYIYPIADVDHLDERRKAMGMPPMKDYVKNWDAGKYKKQLPEIEKLAREQVVK